VVSPNGKPDEYPGEYQHESFMSHINAFDLEVTRRPEGKDEEKTDEDEGPG